MIRQLRRLLNSYLDRWVRPNFYIYDRPRPAFQICGYTGLLGGILLAATMVAWLDLSFWVLGGLILVVVLSFFGLAMVTKIVLGEEKLVSYYHKLVVILGSVLLLWLLRQPLLPYLDVTILGIGMFLVWGRVGCLMAGCCYGRPDDWGVCYRADHAATGFPSYLVGVRLFPIQAVESVWVFCLVLGGVLIIWNNQPPGEVLVWYTIGYSTGRFFFELKRGDPDRSYFWGFSEPQWISVILLLFVTGAELAGILPFHNWHLGITAGVVSIMGLIALKKYWQGTATSDLLSPWHVKEVAEAIDQYALFSGEQTLVSRPESVVMAMKCTSLGIQISIGNIQYGSDRIQHYTLSQRSGIMAEKTARILAELILRLKSLPGSSEIIKGNQGVYHLLVHQEAYRSIKSVA